MTDLTGLKEETALQLDALVEAEGIPARAQASGQALLDKLRAPVRIGLFGLPGSGKRAVLSALSDNVLSDNVLPDGAFSDGTLNDGGEEWPTLELSYGPLAKTQAMLSDGALLHSDGLPTADLLRQEPVFLRIAAPVPALTGRVLLLICSDTQADEMLAGLTWAARRVDLVLWCTRAWTTTEQQIWHAAPDSLRNHAILVFPKGSAPHSPSAYEDGFDTAYAFRQADPRDAGYAGFAEHLSDIIDEATTQDIHAAQMFLRRYANVVPLPRSAVPPVQAAPVKATAVQPTTPVYAADPEDANTPARASVPRPVTRPTASQIAVEAGLELARLFQMLRAAAEDMRLSLIGIRTQDYDTATLLSSFEQIFDTLADRACDLTLLEETCPDLVAQFEEARDLALLMRVEGGAEQVRDAARLLLQLRQDVEHRLVA